MAETTVLSGAAIFDGTRLVEGHALVLTDDRVRGIVPLGEAPGGARIDLGGGILGPGFVDLQVNGGGGEMLCGRSGIAGIARILAAHRALGTTAMLPTLITDTEDATAAVLAAGIAARDLPGFLGLHLEGPHLDPRRKGAHDVALIRPMTEADLARLCEAARQLPALLVTLAPETATPDQIARLTRAGVVVSLGHSDTTAAAAQAAMTAGARVVTHLFNAMSQLSAREPGLVGAALDGPADVGIIADGVHVADAALRIALAAKRQGEVFLVTDAMAVAGTNLTEFSLGGRRILRRNGRLTLEDGTLAGADCDLTQAIRHVVAVGGVPVSRALAMATSIPARVIRAEAGHLRPGARADIVHLTADLRLAAVWQGGQRV